MELLPAIITGLAASIIVYLAAKGLYNMRYFKKAFDFYKTYTPPTGEATDKRVLRRYRKRRPEIKMARTRIGIYIVVIMVIFLITYIFALAIVGAIYGRDAYVKIPYMIPLVAIKRNSEYYIHVVIITLLSFLQPSYLFARVAKIKRYSK